MGRRQCYNSSGTVILCKLTCVPAGVQKRCAVLAPACAVCCIPSPTEKRESYRPFSNLSIRLNAPDAKLIEDFSKLRTFRDVAELLEVDRKTLRHYLRRHGNYRIFSLRKRSGGKRTIATPVTPLKIIQRKLNQVLHAVYGSRSPVHGFVRGKSIVTNAKRHVQRDLILNFDLQDFFPSIHFGRVMGLFEGKPYNCPSNVSVVLAQICCFQQALPVGAPTSPIVANMVCAQLDSQLKRVAQDCGCTYTRYADDITFSVKSGRFPPVIVYRDTGTRRWVIGEAIAKVITSNKFKINDSKTRILPRGYRQEVTGIIVNEGLNVKRRFVRQVRAMLHSVEKWGFDRAQHDFLAKYDRKQRKRVPDFRKVLRGKIEFVGSVRRRDDLIYLNLMSRYLKLVPDAKMSTVVVAAEASTQVLQKALWLLDGEAQGTGFAVDSLGILTAAHVLTPTTTAALPVDGIKPVVIKEIRKDDHVDVARIVADVQAIVQLKLGTAVNLKIGDAIRVIGFPRYRAGDSVNVQHGRITGFSVWHAVPHYIVDCAIVHGNSGGPILNAQNEVIGIAVKGQEIPKKFKSDDELSRFVPIDFALIYLSNAP